MGLLSTEGRSDDIVEIGNKFEIGHLTNPDQRQIGMSFARLAQEMILRIRRDDQGLIDALDKLLDAREEAMVAIAPRERKEQTRQANAARQPAPAGSTKTTSRSKSTSSSSSR